MAMTYVHICDVCGYRLEDTCNDEVPKGWFKIRICEPNRTYWEFLACSNCMKKDEEENKFCKKVCDLFRNRLKG